MAGDYYVWSLNYAGKLVINSDFEMTDYDNGAAHPQYGYVPWYNARTRIEKVIINDGISFVGNYLFQGCTNLRSVSLPDSVQRIGSTAFCGCSRLSSVIIPGNVTSIGDTAFYGCDLLAEAVFVGNPPTTFGQNVFTSCAPDFTIIYPCTLASAWAPNGETTWNGYRLKANHTFGQDHFCTVCGALDPEYGIDGGTCGEKLKWAIDKDGVLTISGTGKMDNWFSNNYAPWYSLRSSINSLVISKGVTSIGNYAFYGCSNLPSVTIPDSVTSIGFDAFTFCSSLASVTIPDSVTSIEGGAFNVCDKLLTAGPIGGGYDYEFGWKTMIPNFAFAGCSKLSSVTIPNSVTSIGYGAFMHCYGLPSVTIPNSVTSIGPEAFAYCTGLITVTLSNCITTIEDAMFQYCESLTSIIIPDSVTSIEMYAFDGCIDLTSVTIPANVTSIEEYAFTCCNSLTAITVNSENTVYYSKGYCIIEKATGKLICGCSTSVIPDDVTCIGDSAFCGFKSLSSITIPDSVTSIGNFAFDGCGNLTSITIPAGVINMGDRAFSSCSKLSKIIFKGNPPITFGQYVFSSCASDFTVLYPCTLASVWAPNGETTWNGYPIEKCHIHTEHFESVEPTCTEIGNCEYWVCADCEKIFSDEACTEELSKGNEVLSANGHAMTHCDAKAATCTETGNIEYWYCSACKGYFLDSAGKIATTQENTIIAASGHSMTHYAAKEATCTETGNIEYWYCSACKGYFLDSVGKTSTSQVKTVIAALGHNLVHHNAQAATYEACGWEAYDTCTRCEYTTYKEIPALVHDPVHHDAQAPTCTEIGWEAYDTCNTCDYTTYKEIPALGHDIVHHDAQAATCTEIGWEAYDTCTRCDYTTYKELPALGHSMRHTAAKATTCTADGNIEYWYCSTCKSSFLDSAGKTATTQEKTVIPALGHSMMHYAAKAADCTIAGNIEYWYCANCKEYFLDAAGKTATTQEKTVIAAAHKFGSDHICTVCGEADPDWFSGSGTDNGNKWTVAPDGTLSVSGSGKLTGKAWADQADKITSVTISEGVTAIGDGAFNGCSKLISVTIPSSVTSIGKDAFNGCSALKSVTVPDTVKSIGSGAFSGCSSLTSAIMPNGLKSIPDNAFKDCGKLASVSIPDTVTSIGDEAFSGCRKLTSVVIPDGVTSIGDMAFYECWSLTCITFPVSLKKIGTGAFKGDEELHDVIFKGTAAQWKGVSVAGGNESLKSALLHTVVTVAVSKTKAKISWTPMDGVTGYMLYIRRDHETKPIKTVTVKKAKTVKSNYTMVQGHTYRFTLAPVVNGKVGMESLETIVEVPLDTPKLKVKSKGNTLSLSWSKIKGAEGYELKVTDSAGNTKTQKFGASVKKATLQVTPSGAYTLSLTAYTALATSKTATVKGTVSLTATALKAKASKGVVNLSWKEVKTADGYEIYRAEGSSSDFKLIATATGKKYVDRGVSVGATYTYKLRPVSKNVYAYGTGPVYGLYTATMKVTVK